MAEITPQGLQDKLNGLRQQHQQTVNQAVAIEGAIAMCQQLITELETEIPLSEPSKA